VQTALLELTYADVPACDSFTAVQVLEDVGWLDIHVLEPVDQSRGVWRVDVTPGDLDLVRRHTLLVGGDDGVSTLRLATVVDPAVIATLDR
jgi:hypothetical protein